MRSVPFMEGEILIVEIRSGKKISSDFIEKLLKMRTAVIEDPSEILEDMKNDSY